MRYLWTAIFSALIAISASSFANVEIEQKIIPSENISVINGADVLTEIRSSHANHFETFEVASLSCGLKPLPPLGCSYNDAECVCVQQGIGQKSCWWQWRC